MGIKNLFREIRDCLVVTHLSELGPCTVAVDGNCWLFQCLRHYYGQILSNDSNAIIKVVRLFMNRVMELQSHGIVPYIVFDGARLPNKKLRSDGCERDRDTNLAKARAATNPADAKKYYTNATTVTHQEIYAVIQALKSEKIKYIVAPYEADPQLAYLCLNGHVDAVLTSDADLIAYGCKKVIFRFSAKNKYRLYDSSKLQGSKAFAGFTQAMVVQTCVLGGCDYLSIPGVGISGAIKAMKDHSRVMTDLEDYIKVIKKAGATDTKNFVKYAQLLRNVTKTFKHQRVYNPEDKTVVHLMPMPEERDEDYLYVGPPIPQELAESIANGDIDPSTKRKMQPLIESRRSWKDELENDLKKGKLDKKISLMDYQKIILEIAELQFGIVSNVIMEEKKLLKVLCPIVGDTSNMLRNHMHEYSQIRKKIVEEEEKYSAKLRKVIIELKDMLEAESKEQERTLSIYSYMTKLRSLHLEKALEIITYGSPKQYGVPGVDKSGYQSGDVASETDNYMDALATMESEVENISNTRIEQLQSQFSDFLSASEDESSSPKNKITSFSYSDTSSSVDNMSPRDVNSPHAFASTEIPFHPRVAPQQSSDNGSEMSDNAALPMDQGVISKESTSKDSDLSELSLNNCLDVSSCKKNEESESDLEDIVASTSELDDVHSSTSNNENNISSISLVTSHVEEQPLGPTLDEPEIDDGDVNPDEEAGVPYSNGGEAELQEKESVSADSVCDPADDINGDDYLPTLEGEKELQEREAESVNLESKDLTPVFVPADVDSNESNILIVDSGDSETEDVSCDLDENEDNGLFTTENGLVIKESDAKESKSSNSVDQNVDQLEGASSITSHSASIEEMADQSHTQSLQLEIVDCKPYPVNHEAILEPSMAALSQLSSHENLPGFNMLPQLAPVNIEDSPPLPPLPPMQWRMGKLQNTSMSTMTDGGLHGFSNIPSPFPPIETPPPLDQNENITNEKSDNGYEDVESSSNELPTEPSVKAEEVAETIVPRPPSDTEPSLNTETEEVAERIAPRPLSDTEPSVNTETEEVAERFVPQPPSDTEPSVNTEKTEEVAERVVPQPPSDKERPVYVFPTEREIIRPSSSLPLIDDERPNGIRPMKIQRPRTPLINAVAAHDKSKLRKVSERAMPPIQKEEDRDTLLEQIRLKSFNLKPSVQTRPSIQGPKNPSLAVAAILEKAHKVRQAAAGSDDDDDSWE